MSRSVPPPSHQEVTRKLSVHSVAKPTKRPTLSTIPPVSGTESDSDSVFSPEVVPPSPLSAVSLSAQMITGSSSQPPLSSIAERRAESGGEESEEDEDEDEGEGGWRAESQQPRGRGSHDETVLKTGYLWKKGERRKTWKKRWFVLRPAHLAFYKTSAEYKLLRLLDLSDIHSCTPVSLKKHANTFGLVSPTRTFYLQAESPSEVQEWVKAITEARTTLLATSTQNSTTAPIPIPSSASRRSYQVTPLTASPSHSPHGHQLTSSESDDASPSGPRSYSTAISPTGAVGEVSSPSKQPGAVTDTSKVILSGYLMKCGSRRHIWHNRWFVLSGEKLIYSRSHMDTKPHRQIPLSQILDALEYDLPAHRNNPTVTSPPLSPPQSSTFSPYGAEGKQAHTFKVVTTKRTLLLCAPSEEEEIKWLSAVRALIARRSGAGVMPGDSAAPASTSKASSTPAATGTPTGVASAAVMGSSGNAEISAHGGAPGISGTSGTSGGSATGRRRDSLVRRLSLSGGGGFTSSVAPQEVISERQS